MLYINIYIYIYIYIRLYISYLYVLGKKAPSQTLD